MSDQGTTQSTFIFFMLSKVKLLQPADYYEAMARIGLGRQITEFFKSALP
jgi:hypothetical protein